MSVAAKPTTTSFPYTFTATDASMGQVTFLATTRIIGHTDALPTDDSRTAVTTVSR